MNTGLASAARELKSYGRGPDTMLAHISPDEVKFLDYVQEGTRVNPATGLPEYGLFGKILKGIARAAGAVVGYTLGGPAGAALGAGLTTKATGGSWNQALTAGALSGLGSFAGNLATGVGSGLTSGASYGPFAVGASGAAAAGLPAGAMTGPISGIPSVLPAGFTGASTAAAPSFMSSLGSTLTSAPGVAAGLGALSTGPRNTGASGEAPDFYNPRPDVTMEDIRKRLKEAGFDPARVTLAPVDVGYRYGYGPEAKFFSNVNPSPRNYADGGRVSGLGPLQAAALQGYMMARKGGVVDPDGPGGGKDDQIQAMLSPDEHVWSAQDTADLGDGSSTVGHKRHEELKKLVRANAGRKNVKGQSGKQKGLGQLLEKAKRKAA